MIKNFTENDITVGFEFFLNDRKVRVKTDYSKNPELMMNSVQVVYVDDEDLSAGQFDKEFILKHLNK